MKYTFICLFLLFFSFSGKAQHFEKWRQEDKLHLQAGYAFSAFNIGTGNMFSLGICKMKIDKGGANDGPLSAIPILTQIYSVNAIGLLTDGKCYPGLKVGYEAQFIILAGRIECSVFPKYVFITPSFGLSLLGLGNVMAGYNIGVNDSKKSGFQVSCNLNFGSL